MENFLASFFDNFWLMSLFVFIATCFMDYYWAVCVKHVTDKNAISSANTAVYYWTATALVTVAYVKDPWYIIPFLAGTWVGTYVAVKMPKIRHWISLNFFSGY